MIVDPTHLTSLFENATEGIILTDRTGRIVMVNPAAETMFGYAGIELVGQPIEVLIPDRYKEHHLELRGQFYHAPSNRMMGQNRDLHGRRKDGSDLPIEVSLSHYKRNESMYVIAFIIDITKRKEVERNLLRQQKELEAISQEIRKLNTDLEAKVEERTMILKEALLRLEQSQSELSEALDKERQLNEIKSRFVAMASHEFRTPLSTVLSSAALLSKYTGSEEQEKRDRHIDKIRNSVKHLNDILEDFLSLGKLDEGKVTLFPVPVNLQELLDDTLDEMRGLLKGSQQFISTCDGEVKITTDKKLLKNVLINLISNAIKFSHDDGIISLRCRCDGARAELSIADQGIGISKADQEHLFSSFFRAANATNIQGTGLGLHIVKRYVDLLGGTVNLHSELERGTTVTITIPIK
ncbi:MAG: hypothetical protein RJA57_1784 [Bacteroidota bacterium]|jgi:PAS domain S-box-containing protein